MDANACRHLPPLTGACHGLCLAHAALACLARPGFGAHPVADVCD